MKNKEKFRDEIFEIACKGNSIAINKYTGELVDCGGVGCKDCAFNNPNKLSCREACCQWANKEYKQAEKRIHWELVPLDTKVYIISELSNDFPAYFASYSSGTGKIRVFNNGRTSFTADIKETQEYSPEQIRLARKTDIKKYER